MEMDFSNKVSIELDFKLLKQRHFLTNFRFWLHGVEVRKSIALIQVTEFSTTVWKISNWVLSSAFICVGKY